LHFLDVPNATASSAQTASELKGEEYYNLLRDAKTALQRAKQALATASTSTSPADRANLQQALHVAQGALQRVDRAMQTQHGDVSDAEVLRRRDALDAFYRDLAALVASGGQLRSVASAPSGGGAILTSPFAPSTRPSGGAGGGGRRLGQPKETERTIGQSNIELLQSQTQIMSDQDTQLASLLPLLQRQRELGQVIGRELDEQNAALDELAGATDGVAAKIARGKKQITKVTGK
jgi:regulator of vacuolar morphogenesis